MPVLVELNSSRLTYPGERRQDPERLALAVDHLTIMEGERIALLGKSGAGKSTLLRHIRRLLPGGASWCPQQASLVPQLKAFHNIYAGSLERHAALTNLANLLYPLRRFRTEITEVAEPLGIAGLLWTKAGELSGGQQQRVAIARALYQQKPILLADEPVAALDRRQGEAVLRLMLEQHSTAVVAMHNAGLALQLCTRVIGLKDQRVVLDCPAAEADGAAIERLYR
ncbi:ATP-binding cassette domain-containing protein [Microbulbifer yueqingensis]|uniref:Phosphonate transport system ATP-binding protein n=1 Tax=Microbulbifer yueqingensis TaxID=658219 RepID=A0A1G9DIP6_9GAMM|nr:ATP-binding cassette domain-containing protein [Microbulbifer yueqingensis]SDK63739.1 phosphonate transport system ATP-binding protein [Microbulbifer yueqingensis]